MRLWPCRCLKSRGVYFVGTSIFDTPSEIRPPGEYRGVAPLHSPHSPPWGSGAGGGLRPKPAPPPQGWGHSKPVKGRFTRPLARVLAALRAAPCDRSPLTASPFRIQHRGPPRSRAGHSFALGRSPSRAPATTSQHFLSFPAAGQRHKAEFYSVESIII